MKNRRYLHMAVLMAITLQVCACSLFTARMQTMDVTAHPTDAEIYINGNFCGRGAASQEVKRNENVQVIVRKAGYETALRSIGHRMSTAGILDIISTPFLIFPVIGLFSDGARNLEQTEIVVELIPMAIVQPEGTQTKEPSEQ